MALGLNCIIHDSSAPACVSGLYSNTLVDSPQKVCVLLQRIYLPSKVLFSIREIENWASENQLGIFKALLHGDHMKKQFSVKRRLKFHVFILFFQ